MLCIAEKGTGFNWKNNDWVLTNYKPYSYVLTKVEPEPERTAARPKWPFTMLASLRSNVPVIHGGPHDSTSHAAVGFVASALLT
jgi:hypothetical protein